VSLAQHWQCRILKAEGYSSAIHNFESFIVAKHILEKGKIYINYVLTFRVTMLVASANLLPKSSPVTVLEADLDEVIFTWIKGVDPERDGRVCKKNIIRLNDCRPEPILQNRQTNLFIPLGHKT
jgi:hypothetical protein